MQNEVIFEYNSIIIIESLRVKDLKTGKNLYDSLRELHPEHKGIQYITVESAEDFSDLISEIEFLMEEHKGFRPIIDIETHGDMSVTQFSDNSTMKWEDLMDRIRRLNKICDNELVLFLACCQGYKFINSMSVTKYSPCGYLYAPSEDIYADTLNEATMIFFNEINVSGDLDKAAKLVEKMNISCFKSEIFFLNSLTHFLIKDYKGSGNLKTDIEREKFINKLSVVFLGESKPRYTAHVISCFNDYIAIE